MGQSAVELGAVRGALRPSLANTLLGPTTPLQPLAILPSNLHAVEAGLAFARGLEPFVALIGPSGWGKSLLLESIAAMVSNAEGREIRVQTAREWIEGFPQADPRGPLVIDEVQDLHRRPRDRQALRFALSRRASLRRPTFLSYGASRPARIHTELLGMGGFWKTVQIVEPTAQERQLIALNVARSAGMHLHDSIIRLIGDHLHGNGRSIVGALNLLQLVKSNWSRREDVVKACGILMPYLIGSNGWDVRDEVHEAITLVLGPNPLLPSDAYFCWVLLHDVGLGEKEAAAFLKITPGQVYSLSQSVKGAAAKVQLEACREAVRERLSG